MIERLINIIDWRYGRQLIPLYTEILVKVTTIHPYSDLFHGRTLFPHKVVIIAFHFCSRMTDLFKNPVKLLCTQLRRSVECAACKPSGKSNLVGSFCLHS